MIETQCVFKIKTGQSGKLVSFFWLKTCEVLHQTSGVSPSRCVPSESLQLARPGVSDGLDLSCRWALTSPSPGTSQNGYKPTKNRKSALTRFNRYSKWIKFWENSISARAFRIRSHSAGLFVYFVFISAFACFDAGHHS